MHLTKNSKRYLISIFSIIIILVLLSVDNEYLHAIYNSPGSSFWNGFATVSSDALFEISIYMLYIIAAIAVVAILSLTLMK